MKTPYILIYIYRLGTQKLNYSVNFYKFHSLKVLATFGSRVYVVILAVLCLKQDNVIDNGERPQVKTGPLSLYSLFAIDNRMLLSYGNVDFGNRTFDLTDVHCTIGL